MGTEETSRLETADANVVSIVSRSAYSLQGNRHIVWFSCGAASTIAADIVRKENPDAMLVRIWLGGEHPDNDRFALDVRRRLGCDMTVIRSNKYNNHFEVIEQTGYVNGPAGARCTTDLKKVPRFNFQLVDDTQYFGYTAEPRERERAERFRERFPEVNVRFPLIEAGLTKQECAGIIEGWGIELPMMYKLGYNNNNCIGCVKGGKGYWNKIREDFPDVFARMAKLERKVKHSCIKGTFLDELQPGEGRHKDFDIACDFMCQGYEEAVALLQKPTHFG